MYIPIEEKIVAYTHGECPCRRKKCDGLCNNCGIINKVLNIPQGHNIKDVPSRQGVELVPSTDTRLNSVF